LIGKEDFIVLGCDGIFEKLDSEEVINEAWRTIKKNKNGSIHEVVGAATQSIVKLCMDKKSSDNLTAILIYLGSFGVGTNPSG
jgi:protein phosphatase 2C family protein 2/3